ncbi:MAG: hypothetical protein ACR2QK_03685, partial [Acidimicrobiales bacterium]
RETETLVAEGVEVADGVEFADDLSTAQPTVEPDTAGEERAAMAGDRGPSKLPTGSPCAICGGEQAAIRINVDGNTLLMESCDGCDVRRWQLAGERIALQEALNQVGEHSGRRR